MTREKPIRQIKLLIGASGSGKSTYIENHTDEFNGYEIISFDSIFPEGCEKENGAPLIISDTIFNSKKEELDKICYDRIREAVKNGKNIIIDRNHSTNEIRKKTLEIAMQSKDFQYISTAILIHPPNEKKHIKNLIKRSFVDGRLGTLNTATLQKIEPIADGLFDQIIEIGKPPKKPLLVDYEKLKHITLQKSLQEAQNFDRKR